MFPSKGHLEAVWVGIGRREARCAEALHAVRGALESDFGAAHLSEGCYKWNPAGTTLQACCEQHRAPDGGFEFMSLVVVQSFGTEEEKLRGHSTLEHRTV